MATDTASRERSDWGILSGGRGLTSGARQCPRTRHRAKGPPPNSKKAPTPPTPKPQSPPQGSTTDPTSRQQGGGQEGGHTTSNQYTCHRRPHAAKRGSINGRKPKRPMEKPGPSEEGRKSQEERRQANPPSAISPQPITRPPKEAKRSNPHTPPGNPRGTAYAPPPPPPSSDASGSKQGLRAQRKQEAIRRAPNGASPPNPYDKSHRYAALQHPSHANALYGLELLESLDSCAVFFCA